jgi:hypothetical protein
MKRLILTSPTGLTFDQLTAEQQAGISSVFAQYIMPMPGTISYGTETYTTTTPDPESTTEVPLPDIIEVYTGLSILDATTTDNFTVEAITALGLPFTVMGMWEWSGSANDALIELQTLDPSFINYLPDTTDEDGNPVPPVLHIPNNWAGWPEVIL